MSSSSPNGDTNTKDVVKAREIVVPMVTTLLGAAIGVYGTDLASADDAITRRTADRFIQALYAEATDPDTVAQAWSRRLSPGLQEIDDLSSFTAWWSNWSDVVIDGPVLANPDVENGFTARIAYVDTQGRRQSYRQVMYQLECSDAAAGHVPGVTCEVDDVRLVDSWQPGTQ